MGELKLTFVELSEIQKGLSIIIDSTENEEYKKELLEKEFCSRDEIFELGYAASKFVRRSKEGLSEFNDAKNKLVAQFGKEDIDKNGNKLGTFSFDATAQIAYGKALAKLEKEEVTLQDVKKLKFSLLKKFGVGGGVLTSCSPIIDFEEKADEVKKEAKK